MIDLDSTVRVIVLQPKPIVAKIVVESGNGGGGSFVLPLVLDGMRITAAGFLQLWNSDQNKYHTLLVQGDAGEEYITIGAGES